MIAKITEKGQVTIPQKIRETLGVRAGDRLFFSLDEGKTVIYPVKGTLLDLKGSVKPKQVPEDLERVRNLVKQKVSRRNMDDGIRRH